MISQDHSHISELIINKLHYFFSNQKIARLIFIISIILLIWCLYLIIIFYKDYIYWKLPEPVQVENLSINNNSNISTIKSKHLFGKTIRPGLTLEDAVKSELPLKIHAVISNSNPKHGTAIISGPDGKERIYQVGDRIFLNGAKSVGQNKIVLEYVYKDKIYIKNGDILEYILYHKLRLDSDIDSKSRFIENSKYANYIPGMKNDYNNNVLSLREAQDTASNYKKFKNYNKYKKYNKNRKKQYN